MNFSVGDTNIRFETSWTTDKEKKMPWSMCTGQFYAIFSLTCAPRSIHTHVNRFVLFCSDFQAEIDTFFFQTSFQFIYWIRYGLLHLICSDVHCHFIWLLSQLINEIYWISMKWWKLCFFTHLMAREKVILRKKERLQSSDKFWKWLKTPIFPHHRS